MLTSSNDNAKEHDYAGPVQGHSCWEEGRAAALAGEAIDLDPYGTRDTIKSGLWRMGFAFVQSGCGSRREE
jgi:hypothetical protein